MASVSYRINSFGISESDSDDDNSVFKSTRNDFSEIEKPKCFENSLKNIQDSSSNKILNNEPNVSNSIEEQQIRRKRKKVNAIWSNVLQDQSLSADFDICDMKRKPIHLEDRYSESYDYRRRKLDDRPDINPDLVKVGNDEIFSVTETFENDDDTTTKDDIVFSNNKNKSRISGKQHKLNAKEYKIAKLIIMKLQERKHNLIFNVVKVLGADKAMELLKKTEHIEKNGGMLVLNKSRKRTPGGVFFHLIKSDHRISKEVSDEIFFEEENFNFKQNGMKLKAFDGQNNSKFHVLQCYSCNAYQVHQKKKTNKWSCKICNEKQSVKQVYCQGTAAECTEQTQKLNLLRGTKERIKESEMELENETIDDASNQVQIPTTSKWSEFLAENEEKMDDGNDLTSIQDHHPIRKENTNFCQKKEESVCSESGEILMTNNETNLSVDSNDFVPSKWNEFA